MCSVTHISLSLCIGRPENANSIKTPANGVIDRNTAIKTQKEINNSKKVMNDSFSDVAINSANQLKLSLISAIYFAGRGGKRKCGGIGFS